MSDPQNLFASARASLNHAPTPVEQPIVSLKRPGMPTIGIAPDKMAAFLTEMKTVRLRKISERQRSPHSQSFSVSAATPAASLARLRQQNSFTVPRPRSTGTESLTMSYPSTISTLTGEKRKRTDSGYLQRIGKY